MTHTVHHDALTHMVHHGAEMGSVHHDAATHVVHHDAVGHTVHHDFAWHLEHHDAVTHTEHHDAVTHTEHYDAVTHTEHHDAGTHTEHHDAVTHAEHVDGYWDDDGNWNEGFDYDVEDSAAYDETITDSEAYDEVVEDSPAYDETVTDAEAYDETITDSQAYDEPVVDSDAYNEYVEDAAAYDETIVDSPASEEPIVVHAAWDEVVVDHEAWDEVVTDQAAWDETVPNSGGGSSTGGGTAGGAIQRSLVSPPPGGSGQSVWRDVKGDGILDEIIPVDGSRVGMILTVEDSGWEDDFGGHWTSDTVRDGDRVYTNFNWSFENVSISPSNDPWATVDILFQPEPSYQYVVWADDIFGYNNNIAAWPAASINRQYRKSTADLEPGKSVLTVSSQRTFLSALARMTWYVIRLGKVDDPETTITPPNSFYCSYTTDNPFTTIFGNQYAPSEPRITGATVESATTAILARIEQLIGRPLLSIEKSEIRDFGCIAVARILMSQPTRRGSGKLVMPSAKFPERADPALWDVKAFAHYLDAEISPCPAGKHELIFAVEGKWIGGGPIPTSSGEVPVDSIDPENWIVRMPPPNENKWFNMSHGLKGGALPQVGVVFDGPPPDDNFPTKAMIFTKVCVKDP